MSQNLKAVGVVVLVVLLYALSHFFLFLFDWIKFLLLAFMGLPLLFLAVKRKSSGKKYLWFSLAGIVISLFLGIKYYAFSLEEEGWTLGSWNIGSTSIVGAATELIWSGDEKTLIEQHADFIAYSNIIVTFLCIGIFFLPQRTLKQM